MVTVHGDGDSNGIELKIDSHPSKLAIVRRAIESFAHGCGFDETGRNELGLVVNEALANVMRHAYQGATDRPIIVKAECRSGRLTISIRDWGNGVDPTRLPQRRPDPLCPGGLGMLCLREMMDEVRYEPQPDGMLLTMSRHRLRQANKGDARDVG
jgi:serine/threonine-protein kinase RsbW